MISYKKKYENRVDDLVCEVIRNTKIRLINDEYLGSIVLGPTGELKSTFSCNEFTSSNFLDVVEEDTVISLILSSPDIKNSYTQLMNEFFQDLENDEDLKDRLVFDKEEFSITIDNIIPLSPAYNPPISTTTNTWDGSISWTSIASTLTSTSISTSGYSNIYFSDRMVIKGLSCIVWVYKKYG